MHIVPSGNEKMILFVKALLSTGRQITRYCFRSIRCLHIGQGIWLERFSPDSLQSDRGVKYDISD